MSGSALKAVSIIIPIFNAAPHIRACLDSVRAQSLQNLEIICVDDASSDQTPDILSRYAASDPRIRVLRHENNRGEGASRNSGLRAARGDYVFHLDADDTIPPAALALLYGKALQHDCDMVRGSFEKVHAGGRRELQQWPIPQAEIINTNIRESPLLQQLPPSHCAYLYQRRFLHANGLGYPEDLAVGLDLVALAGALLAAERVTILPDVVYSYHQSPESVTRGSISLRIPLDAVAARGRAVALLWQAGLKDAALDRLSRWAFDIRRYWVRMPGQLSMSDISQVFDAVRELLGKYSAVPWRLPTAHHHRYLLSLVMSGRDAQARDFLASGAALSGFSSPGELHSALSHVLEVVPSDEGARRRMEMLARTAKSPT